KLALDVARIGVWELDPQRQMTEVDDRIASFFGLDEAGWHPATLFYDHMPETDRARVQEEVQHAIGEGGRFDASFEVIATDGTRRILRGVGQQRPGLGDRGGRRLIGVNLDVTAEVEAARLRELMLREMNHRVKNLFSIISGMLRLAARNADTPKDLVDDVSRRISALARSHDLTQGGRDGIQLGEAIDAAIAPHLEGHEVVLDGPEVSISAGQLTSLALILHEWATNSAKYGVLGPMPGRLQIQWDRTHQPASEEKTNEIRLEWNEFFDEALEQSSESESEGFGTTLVRLSAAQLNGRIEVDVNKTRRTSRLVYDDGEQKS
ncbi:sensor histidine kinase, partial [Acidimangrovimonas sediminis]|uniref:sensor histidine kinase n=1 Tax=Acidimangrovimonas sediminis TaxID=2056283 RepID=UPI002FCDE871